MKRFFIIVVMVLITFSVYADNRNYSDIWNGFTDKERGIFLYGMLINEMFYNQAMQEYFINNPTVSSDAFDLTMYWNDIYGISIGMEYDDILKEFNLFYSNRDNGTVKFYQFYKELILMGYAEKLSLEQQ